MLYIILLTFCIQSFSQVSSISDMDDQYTGTAVMSFLKLPVGAKAAAMGGNAISLLDDPSAVFMNPAIMGGFKDNGIIFSHEEMNFGVRHEYAGWVMPTYGYGSFGAQWNLLGSGTIESARDIDEKPVSTSTSDMSIGAAYGRGFFDNFLLAGANLQFLQSRLADVTARGAAGDIGVTLNLPYSLLSSLCLKNLGAGLTYTNKNEPLPAGIMWDAAAHFLDNRGEITFGIKKFSDSPLKLSGGGEFQIHPSFCGRIGYEYARIKNEQVEPIKGISGGFGIRYGIFRADYAYTRRGEYLQGVHVIDAGFRFGRITPLTDMDYLNRAQKFFKQERYDKCVETAKQALKLNPSMWQAQRLIEEAQRMEQVKKNALVAIFYTGDTRGIFVPNSNQGLGGLARRTGVLKSLYQDYPISVTLDAGNFLHRSIDKSKPEIGYKLLKRMRYAALNFGNGECAFGYDTVFNLAKRIELPCISANLIQKENKLEIQEKATFFLGKKYVLTVIGLLRPVKTQNRNISIADMKQTLARTVTESRSKSDIIIVLCSDSIRQCRELAATVKGIDVIICGAGSPVTYKPYIEGRTLVVSPGPGGENLGFLSLQFSTIKKVISYSNRIIPLDESVPEDGTTATILKRMLMESDSELPDQKLVPSPYILPFVSNFDMTACPYKGIESGSVDSMAIASLDKSISIETVDLDSLKKEFLIQDTLKARKLAIKQGYSGLLDPSDTTDQIYLQYVLTGKTKRITWNKRQNHDPLLNFQGSALLYYADSTQGKITFDGTDKRVIETDIFVYNLPYDYTVKIMPEPGSSIMKAVFSCDGLSVYTVERSKSGRQEIFLKTIGKKIRYDITRSNKGSAGEIAVSPDTKNIAYTSDREEGMQLYLTDPMGGNPSRVTYGSGYCSKMAFSGTGRYLAYAYSNSKKDNSTDLFILDLKTNTLDTLSQNQPVYDIAWNSDKELYITQGINYTDINVLDLKTRSINRLTKRNPDIVESEQHPILFDTGEGTLVYFEKATKNGIKIAFVESISGEVKQAFEGGKAKVRLK